MAAAAAKLESSFKIFNDPCAYIIYTYVCLKKKLLRAWLLVLGGDFNPVVRAGHFALPLPTPPWPVPFGTPRTTVDTDLGSASATANGSGVTAGQRRVAFRETVES